MVREYHINNKIQDISKHKLRNKRAMKLELINALVKSKAIDDETIVKVEMYEGDKKYYEYSVSGLAIEEDSETGQKFLLVRIDV